MELVQLVKKGISIILRQQHVNLLVLIISSETLRTMFAKPVLMHVKNATKQKLALNATQLITAE
jgi:hypothetical protein